MGAGTSVKFMHWNLSDLPTGTQRAYAHAEWHVDSKFQTELFLSGKMQELIAQRCINTFFGQQA